MLESAVVKTCFGYVGLVLSSSYLVRNTPPVPSYDLAEALLTKKLCKDSAVIKTSAEDPRVAMFVEAILKAAQGERVLEEPLLLKLRSLCSFSKITRLVYLTLATIPRGKATTYRALASVFGLSPRIVGFLMSRNPYPVLIPCHKVVKSDRSVGGYMGSLEFSSIKIELLRLEGVRVIGQKVDSRDLLNTRDLMQFIERGLELARILETKLTF